MRSTEPVLDRLLAKTDRRGACWQWNGAKRRSNSKLTYGMLWNNGQTRSSHRVAFEIFVGPVPQGMTLDHLCSNPLCVNPAHLEPVTLQENIRRRDERRVER